MVRLLNGKAIIFSFLCILLNAVSICACYCEKSSFAEAFENSKAIFSGEVVDFEYRKDTTAADPIQNAPNPRRRTGEYEVRFVKIQVEQWWKGNSGGKSEVFLATDYRRYADGASYFSTCDYNFEQGTKYLIYAFENQGLLKTGICKRTTQLEKAEEDLRILGIGKEPGQEEPVK